MEKDFNSDYLRGHIDTIILKTLFDGEKYGYEICKDIEDKSDGAFILKQPSLYSALKRLEANGLIISRWQDSEIGGKRHYYSLTEEGKNHYESSKQEWDYSANIINSLISTTQASQPSNQTQVNIEKHETVSNIINQDSLVEEPTQNSFFNESNSDLEHIYINENKNQEIINITTIEPEKEEIIEEKREKNDAEFINETYIDENNDISFSNNVFLRVKNSLQNTDVEEKISEPIITQATKENIKETSSKSYKIKPYSKFAKSIKNSDFFKVNKFNLFLSLFMFLIISAEIVTFFVVLNKTSNLVSYSKKTFLSVWIVAFIPCAFSLVKLLINPYKKGPVRTKKRYIAKSFICIVCIAIIVSINLLLSPACFSNIFAYTTILLPCIIVINLLLQEVFYNIFKKFTIFSA